jgi:sensor histidine kinase YesM
VTELKALQAQINPHFVYNTLDSVACIALLSGENDIATMVARSQHPEIQRRLFQNGGDA